jgi:alpha-L-rhamnosidase
VITIVPEWFYNFYGDRRILDQNYECMKRWMEFEEHKNLGADFLMAPAFYGDWVDASSMDFPLGDKTSGATSKALMATAFFYQNCRVLARVAGLLEKVEDKKKFEALAANIAPAFRQRFFNSVTGKFESETQCSYVLPLAFGLVPEHDRAAVIKNLVEDVMVKHNGHLTVGFVGMQYLMQALSDIGHPEVAYMIATQTTRPSWGYMISKGATSIWERWDTDTQESGMNGESQCILSGNLEAWFYQTLAGINWDADHPGFKHIILRPRPVGDLRFVKTWHESPYGRIDSEWEITDGVFRWNLTVPPNATATVYVPGKGQNVTEGGEPATKARGVHSVPSEGGAAVYEVGSGSYSFAAPWGHPPGGEK